MRKEEVEHIDQMCRGVIFHPRARFSSSERHSGERSFILLVCSAGVRLIRRCRHSPRGLLGDHSRERGQSSCLECVRAVVEANSCLLKSYDADEKRRLHPIDLLQWTSLYRSCWSMNDGRTGSRVSCIPLQKVNTGTVKVFMDSLISCNDIMKFNEI